MNPSETARGESYVASDSRPTIGVTPGEQLLFEGFDLRAPSCPDGKGSPEVVHGFVQGYLPFVRVIDLDGRIRLIPEAEYRQHKASGLTEIPSTLCLDPDRAPPPQTMRHAARKRESKHILLAKALLLLREHPEWSNRRLGGELGVHHSTLSTSPEFQHARRLNQRTRPVGYGRHRDPDQLSYDRRPSRIDED